MIPRLSSSSISFEANKPNSVRNLYNAHLNSVSQTAQKQATMVTSPGVTSPYLNSKTLNRPIPMHGNGQKLDTIA